MRPAHTLRHIPALLVVCLIAQFLPAMHAAASSVRAQDAPQQLGILGRTSSVAAGVTSHNLQFQKSDHSQVKIATLARGGNFAAHARHGSAIGVPPQSSDCLGKPLVERGRDPAFSLN